MVFVATDKDGQETIFEIKPTREIDVWSNSEYREHYVELPSGSIRKLIGRDLTWEDEPVEIK